jgi:hypothetical protein
MPRGPAQPGGRIARMPTAKMPRGMMPGQGRMTYQHAQGIQSAALSGGGSLAENIQRLVYGPQEIQLGEDQNQARLDQQVELNRRAQDQNTMALMTQFAGQKRQELMIQQEREAQRQWQTTLFQGQREDAEKARATQERIAKMTLASQLAGHAMMAGKGKHGQHYSPEQIMQMVNNSTGGLTAPTGAPAQTATTDGTAPPTVPAGLPTAVATARTGGGRQRGGAAATTKPASPGGQQQGMSPIVRPISDGIVKNYGYQVGSPEHTQLLNSAIDQNIAAARQHNDSTHAQALEIEKKKLNTPKPKQPPAMGQPPASSQAPDTRGIVQKMGDYIVGRPPTILGTPLQQAPPVNSGATSDEMRKLYKNKK